VIERASDESFCLVLFCSSLFQVGTIEMRWRWIDCDLVIISTHLVSELSSIPIHRHLAISIRLISYPWGFLSFTNPVRWGSNYIVLHTLILSSCCKSFCDTDQSRLGAIIDSSFYISTTL